MLEQSERAARLPCPLVDQASPVTNRNMLFQDVRKVDPSEIYYMHHPLHQLLHYSAQSHS